MGGAEAALVEELAELGLAATAGMGSARAEGSLSEVYRTLMWSRLASRVIWPLEAFEVDDADSLYERAHAIAWEEHFGPQDTFVVEVAGRHRGLTHERFVAQRVKDAIVDRFREQGLARPSVDRREPDIRVHVHLTEGPDREPHAGERELGRGRAALGLNLAGASLAHRGYRTVRTEAPLREPLAAWMLRCADYRGQRPLVDPFCGSGTIAIEAAWIALDIAPGLVRLERHPQRRGVTAWRGHVASELAAVVDEARERRAKAAKRAPTILASDASLGALAAAKQNAITAGVFERLRLVRRRFDQIEVPPGEGLMVTNPPYGERLGRESELGALYQQIGDVLRQRFLGYRAFVLVGSPRLTKRLGLRAASSRRIRNGPIDCQLIELPISKTPAQGPAPGWQKAHPESDMFRNRFRKGLRKWSKWAKRWPTDAYRVYDGDIPEYNVSVDVYGGRARIEELSRPRSIDDRVADRRLRDVETVVAKELSIPSEAVTLRVRRRRGRTEQHQRRADHGSFHEVTEDGLRYLVNLDDYLDTGLYLDDREVRRWLRARSDGRAALNLFAYTCAASVAALAGGARSVTSVDLSGRYLKWGERNVALNDASANHQSIRADVLEWLRDRTNRYELIFLAPPSHSRSKNMRGELDLQRDHVQLIERTARLLAPGGTLLFTTNAQKFELGGLAPELEVRNHGRSLVPADFSRSRRAPTAFEITLRR